jgi:hypothetical protein
MRTAVRNDPWLLIWQPFSRVDDFGLQSNFTIGVVAVLNFDRLPGFYSHVISPLDSR